MTPIDFCHRGFPSFNGQLDVCSNNDTTLYFLRQQADEHTSPHELHRRFMNAALGLHRIGSASPTEHFRSHLAQSHWLTGELVSLCPCGDNECPQATQLGVRLDDITFVMDPSYSCYYEGGGTLSPQEGDIIAFEPPVLQKGATIVEVIFFLVARLKKA